MSRLPAGTVTFLFTDIEGSTNLWEQNPAIMRPSLARHDDLLRDAIARHNGHVFKTIGDAFCAAFATANEALSAALDAQLALHAEPWELPAPLRVRIALHAGASDERGGDYFGPPLNRVARLLAAGHGGQILLTEVVQDLTYESLPDLASFRNLGRQRLKDLGRAEQVFQLLHPALPVDFPPLKSLDSFALPHNLPSQPTSFIGREKEVAEIGALVAKVRLVTLTGTGGSGKTRLSLQVATDLLEGNRDGVWLVELAPLNNPELVPQAVALILGIQEQVGQPIRRTLLEWLSSKRLLLILDNCEHLVAACASLVADLLRGCPHIHILASSREALNVAGEQTYRVPSLAMPDPTQPQTGESLLQYAAVRLFIERAQAVQPAFTLNNTNANTIAQVCFHLDGIPLAIELAAARLRSMSVEEVNARLSNRFRLLVGGSRTLLPRQQTLRALIDWSYELLTEAEKALLRRLSVFAGGWTLEAAEEVCAGDDVEDGEVLDLLTGLVDKSLVLMETEEHSARYRLLETVRQYAGDRLSEGGGEAAVRPRHAAWFLALAEQAEPQLWGPNQGVWLSRLDAEHDNLRAVLAWYEWPPESSEAVAVETGLRLAGALRRFWSARGYLSEGRQWLGRVLEREGGGNPTDSAALSHRAKALHGAGILAFIQADYAASRTLYEQSLTIRRSLGDQSGIAACLIHLGMVASYQGNQAAARALIEEGLTLSRQTGDTIGIASGLADLAFVTYNQGDYAAARIFQEESLALRRRLDDQAGIARGLGNLGLIAYGQGDFASARALHEESLALYRELGDPGGIARGLGNIGAVASAQGDFVSAQALLEECLTLYRQVGNRTGIAYCLEGIAGVVQEQSRQQRRVQLYGATDALREAIGSPLTHFGLEKKERLLSVARAVLGDAAFTAAWAVGRAMTLDQAVEYALGAEDG
jgi:predicted ATPase/class 3 adenylate cyclase